MARVRVLIADDHAPTRQEIARALEDGGPFEICALARDAPAAVAAALRERPDVCLLDVRMPGNGIAAAWEIHSRLPMTRIVMLTVSHDDGDLFAALRAGASGYVLKDLNPRRLPRAVLAVANGEAAVPRALVGRIIDQFRDQGARRRAPAVEPRGALLTSREWQVLDLLRQGLTTAQIARRLVVSPVTVRTHLRAVMLKLGVDDRDELIRRFGR
jgi:DNA-binding NarL/FixJ family response regulator